MKVIALIVSGGEGKRFDRKLPKQFFEINNETILERSVRIFYETNFFNEIFVVSNSKFYSLSQNILKKYKIKIVNGGNTRQESVKKGLDKIKRYKIDKVIIHDAVRPFFSKELLRSIILNLKKFECVVPATKVFDSVRSYKRKKYEDIQREGLNLIQTPQGFDFKKIYDAHQKFKKDQFTDDSMLAYKNECQIKIIDGEILNFKVTEKNDFKKLKKFYENNLSDFRVGNGFDVHKFTEGNFIKLLGIKIPCKKSLEGHSDADVGIHALVDSILGAISKGDIGDYFPPSENKWKNKDSEFFLKYSKKMLDEENFFINNVDITLICENPKVSPFKLKMRENISKILQISEGRVNIKATTTEKLGFLGRNEGIACQVTTTISKKI